MLKIPTLFLHKIVKSLQYLLHKTDPPPLYKKEGLYFQPITPHQYIFATNSLQITLQLQLPNCQTCHTKINHFCPQMSLEIPTKSWRVWIHHFVVLGEFFLFLSRYVEVLLWIPTPTAWARLFNEKQVEMITRSNTLGTLTFAVTQLYWWESYDQLFW